MLSSHSKAIASLVASEESKKEVSELLPKKKGEAKDRPRPHVLLLILHPRAHGMVPSISIPARQSAFGKVLHYRKCTVDDSTAPDPSRRCIVAA